MKNPLYNRIPREIKSEFGKYLALFLFIALTVGLISGYIVANGSMIKAYEKSYSVDKIENGHFSVAMEPDKKFEKVLSDLAKKENVEFSKQFYKQKTIKEGKLKDDTFRIYKDRHSQNKIEVMKGKMPKQSNEIVVDRLYAENNNVNIGRKLKIDDKTFRITGLVAFSDYKTLFKNNADMMFDAQRFTVAMVNDEAWNEFSNSGINYQYAWRNNDQKLTDKEQRKKSDAIKEELVKHTILTDILPRPDNNALFFALDDLKKDVVMMQWFFYIIMVVMAFIFAISARSSIEKEARMIGTLRATGYKRHELLTYFMVTPTLVSILAAIVGNIFGYTYMKNLIVKAYYHSYSLPDYTTIWSSEAFFKTTVSPLVIVLVINLIVIALALRTEPLELLRGSLRHRKKSSNAVKLPNWKFTSRFRSRIIMQNIGSYLTLSFGILLAVVMMLFGIMLTPLVQHARTDIEGSMFAKYQYVLKAPYEANVESAEKYAFSSLKNYNKEDIGVYGFKENSKYFKSELVKTEKKEAVPVVISSAYKEKYNLKEGDKFKLKDKFNDKKYTFVVKRTYEYPSSMCIFMPLDKYNQVFGKSSDYYIGYLSNKKLTEIDENFIATIITKADLTLTADQIENSMGTILQLFSVFATILYILILYLLSKVAIDKNAKSISLIKILGFKDKEISKLYVRATGIVTVVALLVSSFLAIRIMVWIYHTMMMDYSGWMSLYIDPSCYVRILVIGAVCYFFVSKILLRHIRKIPMSDALKAIE